MTHPSSITKSGSNPYQLLNRYVLRTPLYPISQYLNWIQTEKLSEADFQKLLEDPIFTEALYLASPELVAQITKWENGFLSDKDKKQRLQLAVLKYATRIASRCTPFGLFAACSTGTFNSETEVELNAVKNGARVTRFDMSFLYLLIAELLKDPEIKQQVLFYPNTSLYRVGNQYRYVEYTLQKDKRSYAIEGFFYETYLEEVLQAAKQGKTIAHLASILLDDKITRADAELFIAELIENQILISELELKVTGGDFLTELLKKLSKNSQPYKALKALQGLVSKLDRNFGNSITDYTHIVEKAKQIVQGFNPKHLLQTDSFSNFKNNTLAYKIKKQLKKACHIFNKMTIPSEQTDLRNFKRNFKKRYDENEMPLNLVLDVEGGIGYGSGQHTNNYLIDELSFKSTAKRIHRVNWIDFDSILFDKYTEAIANKQYSIVLTDQDLNDLPEHWSDLPDTFSGMAEVYSNLGKKKVFISGFSGSSATYLLGRFGNGNKQIFKQLNSIVQIENELHPTKILAEIVHLPQSRTGNVLQRPALRGYEIPYLGNASVPRDKQIPINDIMVSVIHDKVVLRSKKLNKEILPRLSNAHNFKQHALPLYQFLCDVQTDRLRGSIGFHWNPIFLESPFLPRVEYGDLIFSKARWNIKTATLKNLMAQKNTTEALLKWRDQLQMPQYVELVEGDNRLLINLNNTTSLNMLLNAVKNKNKFIFEEFLFTDDGIVKRQDASFCNQFVVSFYKAARLNEVKNG